MEAIILAGGMGTRLKSVVSELPKPMAPINGKPFLAYLLDYLSRFPIEHIVLSVGYQWEFISDYFGECYSGMTIDYSIEDEPLGTGGAVKKALALCWNNHVLLLNGDTFFDVDLTFLLDIHQRKDAYITLALKEMLHFDRYGTVEFEDTRVTAFREKAFTAHGYINGGVYALRADLFDDINLPTKFSLETDFLYKKYSELYFACVPFSGNFIDIGIPEDYSAAQSKLPEWMQYE